MATRRAAARRSQQGRGQGGRAAWVRVTWVAQPDQIPYEHELALRHLGVQTRSWKIHHTDEEKRRICSVAIPAGQKRWAEEILFVQLGLVPGDGKSLDPATRRRMAAQPAGYTPSSKWQGTPRGRVTLRDRFTDLLAVVMAGLRPGRDPRGIETKDELEGR